MTTVRKHSRKTKKGTTTVRKHYRKKCKKALSIKKQERKTEYDCKDYVGLTRMTFEEWLDSAGGLDELIMYHGINIEEYFYTIDDPDFKEEKWKEWEDQLKSNLKDELEIEYYKWIEKYEDFEYPLPLYRAIMSDNVDFNKIGIYWTDSSSHPEAYGGLGGRMVIVKANVYPDDIDWYNTILVNMAPYAGGDEQEIRLKKGKKVLITKMKDEKLNQVLIRDVEATT